KPLQRIAAWHFHRPVAGQCEQDSTGPFWNRKNRDRLSCLFHWRAARYGASAGALRAHFLVLRSASGNRRARAKIAARSTAALVHHAPRHLLSRQFHPRRLPLLPPRPLPQIVSHANTEQPSFRAKRGISLASHFPVKLGVYSSSVGCR